MDPDRASRLRRLVEPLTARALSIDPDDPPWRPIVERGSRELTERGYVALPPLVPAELIALLRDYYRALIAEGFTQHGDPHIPNRHVFHNEPFGRILLERFAPLVRRLVCAPIKPAYSYFCEYFAEAFLPRHRDRPQCEYSISLLVDYRPSAPSGASPWPLRLHVSESEPPVEIYQSPGEALVYRGRQIAHSRAALPPGDTSMHMLLHWVDESFTKPLD